jgi:NAD(P)-dependent dehydrogenase (short-subunit alcohol dehydrogenase family)
MKAILVTGGAGFVGSHACKALSRAGHLPVTFDNFERGHERAVKWGPLEGATCEVRRTPTLAAARYDGRPQPRPGCAAAGPNRPLAGRAMLFYSAESIGRALMPWRLGAARVAWFATECLYAPPTTPLFDRFLRANVPPCAIGPT